MSRRSKHRRLVTINRKLAKQVWGDILDPLHVHSLSELTRSFGFSIAMGDMLFLGGGWYVTHAGLISLAKRHYCAGIDVEAVSKFCDPIAARWSFKATVYKSINGRGFVGHGDADPSNVSPIVRGAEMRVAETRAVTVLCEKRTVLAFAPSRNWDGLPNRQSQLSLRAIQMTLMRQMAPMAIRVGSATSSAF
jgi:hypothetical protein